jgi:hypothetical protein
MQVLVKKEKICSKHHSFPAFYFSPDVHMDTITNNNSHEHGSAITVLNSPQFIKPPFKKQDWMSDEYLDSILSLPSERTPIRD